MNINSCKTKKGELQMNKETLQKRVNFAIISVVEDANPNGDPLSGNRPRQEGDFGEMTDVCYKRKIRNRMMQLGHSVFVQPQFESTDGYKNLRDRAKGSLDYKKGNPTLFAEEACKKWLDVRAFGQVFAFTDRHKDGLESLSVGIKGPITINVGKTVDPINIIETQITKCVNNESKKSKKQDDNDIFTDEGKTSDTMGMKYRVQKGIYVTFGGINAFRAEKTGFTDADAEIIKGILPSIYENDCSSARPEGSMEVLSVVWWEHDCKSGQINSRKLKESLVVDSDGGIKLVNPDGSEITKDDCPENYPYPEIISGW